MCPCYLRLFRDQSESLAGLTLVIIFFSISLPSAVTHTQASASAIVKRISDKLIGVDELLHVVLVEACQELQVNLGQEELLERGLEVSYGELLSSTSLNIDGIRGEATLEVTLLSQSLLDIDLEIKNWLCLLLDELRDHIGSKRTLPVSVDLRPEGAQLRLSADFRTKLQSLAKKLDHLCLCVFTITACMLLEILPSLILQQV